MTQNTLVKKHHHLLVSACAPKNKVGKFKTIKCYTQKLSRIPFLKENQNFKKYSESELFFEVCLRNLGFFPRSELAALTSIGKINPIIDNLDPRTGQMWETDELNKILNSVDAKNRTKLFDLIDSEDFQPVNFEMKERIGDLKSSDCCKKDFDYPETPATKIENYVHINEENCKLDLFHKHDISKQ